MDHIYTITRLIEVSRVYKKPLCLTFIELKKAFDSVGTVAVMEALTNQVLPTPYIEILRESLKYHAKIGIGRYGNENRRSTTLPSSLRR
ncbi:hypothetical protein DICVIV_12548 [Dictyocaulus viviparus]|uniref:Reverse transcriptase domain-containing protein n=1 Tax=Dictyocaulus viviparus TaxID=29172 RepID=A0A0D8XCT8_DICVI|nr:hypothetical protein DICVIV_12548 [Dictyocaulus viviparus]